MIATRDPNQPNGHVRAAARKTARIFAAVRAANPQIAWPNADSRKGDTLEITFEPCETCAGKGGELEHDMQGDGVWATPVTYFMACDDCLLNGLCPGCSRAIPADEAEIATTRTDDWKCGACGWELDDSRFEPSDPAE